MTNISAADISLQYMMYLIARNEFIITLAAKRDAIMHNWQKTQNLQPGADEGPRSGPEATLLLCCAGVFDSCPLSPEQPLWFPGGSRASRQGGKLARCL